MALAAQGDSIEHIKNQFGIGFKGQDMMCLNVTIAWLPACLAGIVVSLENLLAPFFVFVLVVKHYSPSMRGIFFPFGIETTTEPALETIGNFIFRLLCKLHTETGMFGSSSLLCIFAENFLLPFRTRLSSVVPSYQFGLASYSYVVFLQKISYANFRASKFVCDSVNAFELGAIQVKQLFLGGFNWHLSISSLPGFDSVFSEPITDGRTCFLYGGSNFCYCHSLDDIHLVKLLFTKHRGTPGFSVVP